MTEPIRIPVFADLRDGTRYAEVTNEIARQIVALAAAAPTPAVGVDYYRVCPDCGKSVLWGSMGPKEYHDCKAVAVEAPVKPLTPAEVRAMCLQDHQGGSDQPAGDEAAVEALLASGSVHVARNLGGSWNRLNAKETAIAHLAAIRRGEVPGIWATRLDPEKVRSAQDVISGVIPVLKPLVGFHANGPLTE